MAGFRIAHNISPDPTPKAKACSVDNCTRPAKSKGMCNTHYERIRVNGTLVVKSLLEDLSGRQFGMLTVLNFAGRQKKVSLWNCRCECGTESVVQASNLKTGHTTSCGCSIVHDGNRTHGMSTSGTYRSWVAMKRRCDNANYHEWHLYGGRGIRVCDRWKDSFEAFVEDMGIRPDGCTLDRKNVELGYSKDNCRWATHAEQAKNKRNSAFPGKSLKDICDDHGLNVHTVASRIRKQGMTIEQALSAPLKRRVS